MPAEESCCFSHLHGQDLGHVSAAISYREGRLVVAPTVAVAARGFHIGQEVDVELADATPLTGLATAPPAAEQEAFGTESSHASLWTRGEQ